MNLHPTYRFPDLFLVADDDACIPGLGRLADACHAHDCKVFGQLFHAGRAVRASVDGSRGLAYSASAAPDERLQDRAGSHAKVHDPPRVVANHGDAARRFQQAGLDGVEVMASMGYLTAQFLNERDQQRAATSTAAVSTTACASCANAWRTFATRPAAR